MKKSYCIYLHLLRFYQSCPDLFSFYYFSPPIFSYRICNLQSHLQLVIFHALLLVQLESAEKLCPVIISLIYFLRTYLLSQYTVLQYSTRLLEYWISQLRYFSNVFKVIVKYIIVPVFPIYSSGLSLYRTFSYKSQNRHFPPEKFYSN